MKLLQMVKIFFVTRFGKKKSFSDDAVADVTYFLRLESTRRFWIDHMIDVYSTEQDTSILQTDV